MSTYIEDAQGNIISDPINETNTKYPFIPKNESDIKDAMDNQLDYQYMYNEDNPVSNIDTDVYDNYRNRVEELRTKTESYYEALEACLVPAEVKGMAFQPLEYVKETDSEGKEKQVKRNSLQYFFQDHPSNISSNYKEYCFRTNKVKFTDDRNHRLIYDREIHILSTKEDEDNAVPFKNVILRTFFSNITTTGFSNVSNLNTLGQSVLFMVVILNIVGCGMGSTAGGVKQYRLAIAIKSFYWNCRDRLSNRQYIYPYYIWRTGERKEVTNSDSAEAFGYILLYTSVLLVGAVLVTIFGATQNLDYGTALFEFSNALSGTGLTNGLTAVANKGMLWVLILGMFAGRLEILAIHFAFVRIVRDVLKKETI